MKKPVKLVYTKGILNAIEISPALGSNITTTLRGSTITYASPNGDAALPAEGLALSTFTADLSESLGAEKADLYIRQAMGLTMQFQQAIPLTKLDHELAKIERRQSRDAYFQGLA